MNEYQLNRAFNQLKSGQIISSLTITRGLANISYLITANTGEKYVIRQLRAQPIDNARNEITIQKALKAEGINVPIYLTLKEGDTVGHESGHAFTISAFLEGVGPVRRNLALAYSYGKTLAHIHNALDPNKIKIPPNPAQWLRPGNARENITISNDPPRNSLLRRFEASKHIFELGLPIAIIHGDLMEDNVFAKDDKITAIFDLETAEESIRVLDIARSFLSLGYRHELRPDDLRDALFEGYNSTARKQLTVDEKKHFPLALNYTAAACSAWLVHNNGGEFVQPFINTAQSLQT